MTQGITQTEFSEKARKHWTPEREAKLTGGKNLLVKPTTAPELLRVLGLLNADGSMSADTTRKYLQINHMLALIVPELDELTKRHTVVRVLDAGCGNSFLTLLIAWYLRERSGKACEVIGIDRDPKVIGQSRKRAEALGFCDTLRFAEGKLDAQSWESAYRATFAAKQEPADIPRPNLLVALHACDTATDAALALGVTLKADVLAVAPCCQAELAAKWKNAAAAEHAFAPIFRSPNLRRETATQITDALRMLLVRSRGYEVTATEFIESAHTPKNRLIVAVRRGNYLKAAALQYEALKQAVGGCSIALEGMLSDASGSKVEPGSQQ
jgi:SAM-dependent methyltransferase